MKKAVTPITIKKAVLILCMALMTVLSIGFTPTPSYAACPICPTCKPLIVNCSKEACECQSNKDTPKTIKHITDEFILHREWIIKILWEAHVLPAMMLMTEQISAFAMQQMLIVGSLFDAKHQLETQRLLQEMQAQAHKDYQPSEGMCHFATNTRSLAASDRNAKFTQSALASRFVQRQMMNGDGISAGGQRDDARSRFAQFKKTYCNPGDYDNQLKELCESTDPARFNKDIDFTHTIGSAGTLEVDFADTDPTKDEEDVLALGANLYGYKIMPNVDGGQMTDDDGNLIPQGAIAYLKTRSLIAQRSVAHAAFAAQTAMKAQGEDKVLPYMEALFKEMGVEEKDIKTMLGDRPSYFIQMELLTKKLYQTPNFYAALYDKPTNIDRKNVSMQAIDLMQRRDMYNSQLRSEAIMSVWLETSLQETEDLFINETNPMKENKILDIPGLN